LLIDCVLPPPGFFQSPFAPSPRSPLWVCPLFVEGHWFFGPLCTSFPPLSFYLCSWPPPFEVIFFLRQPPPSGFYAFSFGVFYPADFVVRAGMPVTQTSSGCFSSPFTSYVCHCFFTDYDVAHVWSNRYASPSSPLHRPPFCAGRVDVALFLQTPFPTCRPN